MVELVNLYFFRSVALVVCVIAGLPPVPLMVSVYVPRATDPGTVTFKVVEEPVVGFGVKLALAPAGRPVTDMVSGELKPPVGVIVTV